MKIYSLAELKKIVREQGFKMAALRGPDGDKVVPFNKYKKTAQNLDEQFKVFETRLKGNVYPDGVYYVLLAHNINAAKNPKEFAITKGRVSQDELSEAEKRAIPLTASVVVKDESVLSWESAVKMNQEIADLKSKVSTLEFQNKQLLEQLAAYEEEEEEKEGILAEGSTGSVLADTLKSILPTVQTGFEKWFELEEKKIGLEAMKLNKQAASGQSPKPAKKVVKIGSDEHIAIIDRLFESDSPESEERFNAELDKIQSLNPDLYDQLMARYFPDNGGQGNENEGGQND